MSQNRLSYLDIAQSLDINMGETVLVSSDIRTLFYKEYLETHEFADINSFIDVLIAKVGPTGTLLFPTFNWDFCHDVPFNYNKTKGKTGALGNACLQRADFKRTKHALYSFAVYGKDKDYLCSLDFEDAFCSNSIFAYLDSKHAKQITIDVKLNKCFTFIHYVESMVKLPIPYRYNKKFTGTYIDESGNTSTKTYSMLVRDLVLFLGHNYDPLEEELLHLGQANRKIIDEMVFIVIPDLHEVVDTIKNDILNNQSRKICQFIGQ